MMYYLDEKDYRGKREDIGEIMLQFSQYLYKKTGLSLNIWVGSIDCESTHDANGSALQVLHEEFISKSLTPQECVEKMVYYIQAIQTENDELLIIDPYLFSEREDSDYSDMLTRILKSSNAKRIIIITNKSGKRFNAKLWDKVKQSLCTVGIVDIELVDSDKFHDRFWIFNRRKGFLCGTSLNGIGKKFSLIAMLEEDDVKSIIDTVDSMNC